MATEYRNGDLKRILERVARDGEEQTKLALAAVAAEMAKQAQADAHVVSGQLRSSMSATEVVQDGQGLTVGITSSVPYAKYHPRLFKKVAKAVAPRVEPLMKPLYTRWR